MLPSRDEARKAVQYLLLRTLNTKCDTAIAILTAYASGELVVPMTREEIYHTIKQIVSWGCEHEEDTEKQADALVGKVGGK
jgi:hypothetical protein